jgi:predicted amidophosphoribosyltransferase
LQWWVGRNLVTSDCPLCLNELTAPRQAQIQCPHCGEPLQVDRQKFIRLTPPGTIDIEVQAIE